MKWPVSLRRLLRRSPVKPARSATSERQPDGQTNTATYRRNRTMTSRSSMPEVSERARVHHLRALRQKIGFILIGVLACIGVLGLLISQFSGSVQPVTGQTSLVRSIDTDAYQALFTSYYKEHPLERFRFLTNYERLTASIQESAPEVSLIEPAGIEEIGVSRYALTMRQPVASWVVESQRFYVDARGVTFTQNYFQDPTVSVVDNSGADVDQGAAVASSRLLSFVGRVVALSAEQGVVIESIEIPTQSMRQLTLKGKGMPDVRVTIDRGVEEQVQDMAAALAHLNKTKQSPDYIDVRVRGKAFYK